MFENKKIEIAKVMIPPLLTIIFFTVAIFLVILPYFRESLIDKEREMITALTQTVHDILAYYDNQARSGNMQIETAQKLAIQQIRELRYGSDRKDYFWINDMQPRMIMHPYRTDLEGQDVSKFSDPQGKLLFLEVVRLVSKGSPGYLDYTWQWKDDPTRIEPKISYVKLFRPWGWVIGTGVYTKDIHNEIAAIVKRVIVISLLILIIILLLSVNIIQKSLREMNKRREAEQELDGYKGQLERLVEKRTAELKDAMVKIKTLSGFLPICSACKKIRDDKGFWKQLEAYISEHSEAEFSHSICPDCAKKMYPEYFQDQT